MTSKHLLIIESWTEAPSNTRVAALIASNSLLAVGKFCGCDGCLDGDDGDMGKGVGLRVGNWLCIPVE